MCIAGAFSAINFPLMNRREILSRSMTAARFLGVRRSAPKTPFERTLRRLKRAAFILLLFYAGLQAFPQVLFAHSVSAPGITLYSRDPLPPEASACLTRAAGLLQASELAVPGRQERIFVCDAPWVFHLFSPTSTQAFACSVPLTDNVFIATANYRRDVARSAAPNYNSRSLSAVIAHEITHGLIRHHLGWWRGVGLPAWVAEGYCDYVAREGSFPAPEGWRLMTSGQGDPSMSFRYFEYRQMVRYLAEDEHLSFDQIVARANDPAAVEAATRQALRSRTAPSSTGRPGRVSPPCGQA